LQAGKRKPSTLFACGETVDIGAAGTATITVTSAKTKDKAVSFFRETGKK